MLIRPHCFNTYLFAGLLALLASGCTAPPKDAKEAKDDKKVESAMRIHLEVNPHPAAKHTKVNVGRSGPLQVTVDTEPFLTELLVDKASVVDALGGFVLNIQFNSDGAILLEQYTGSYNGRRMAI